MAADPDHQRGELLGAAEAMVGAWEARFGGFERHPATVPDPARLEQAWAAFAARMDDHYPFFHPRYAAQMLKPPNPVAAAGYLAAMLINPNNHALDGGPATSALEVEAVDELGRDVRSAGAVPRAPHLERHDRQPRGAVGRARAAPGAPHRPQRRGALHPRAHVRRAWRGGHGRCGHTRRAHRPRRRRSGVPPRRRGDDRADPGDDGRRCGRPRRRGAGAARALRRAHPRRCGLRRLLQPPGNGPRAAGRPGAVRRCRGVRLDRHRSAQARTAALRVRRGAVRRPRRRPAVQARLSVHVLHVWRAAPRRDQPRVLAGGRGRRGAVADAAGLPAGGAKGSARSSRPAGARRRTGRRAWPPPSCSSCIWNPSSTS